MNFPSQAMDEIKLMGRNDPGLATRTNRVGHAASRHGLGELFQATRGVDAEELQESMKFNR